MAEQADENSFDPQGPVESDVVPKAGPELKTPKSQGSYLKFINYARIAVAIAMAICGAGFYIFFQRHDYLIETLRRAPGIWTWGTWAFGIGVLACLIATLALVIEYVARPTAPKPITPRSLFIRSLFIIIIIAAICYLMLIAFGPGQGIGAAIGTYLIIAVFKKDNPWRVACAILAVIVIGLTLLGTQSVYQYARWHADEIVVASCELMDKCQETDIGQELSLSDPRVPKVFRKLGAKNILIYENQVSIYVSGFTEAEFIINRNPVARLDPVWIKNRGKGGGDIEITDRLWMIIND